LNQERKVAELQQELEDLQKELALRPTHEDLSALRLKFEPWKDMCGVGMLLERGPHGMCQVTQLLPSKAAELCGVIQVFDVLYKGARICTFCPYCLRCSMAMHVLILVSCLCAVDGTFIDGW
jgi:hypothetical protein